MATANPGTSSSDIVICMIAELSIVFGTGTLLSSVTRFFLSNDFFELRISVAWLFHELSFKCCFKCYTIIILRNNLYLVSMPRPRFVYVVAIFIFSLIFIVIVHSTYPSSSSIMFIKLDFKEPFFFLIFSANFSHKKLALTLYKTTIRKSFSITLSLTLFFFISISMLI